MLKPEQKIAEHPLLVQRIAVLEAQVSWFKEQIFGGGKSEKLDPAQRQLALGVDLAREAVVERTEKITYERTKNCKRRLELSITHQYRRPLKRGVRWSG